MDPFAEVTATANVAVCGVVLINSCNAAALHSQPVAVRSHMIKARQGRMDAAIDTLGSKRCLLPHELRDV